MRTEARAEGEAAQGRFSGFCLLVRLSAIDNKNSVINPKSFAFVNRITRRANQPSTNDVNEIEFLDLTRNAPAAFEARDS